MKKMQFCVFRIENKTFPFTCIIGKFDTIDEANNLADHLRLVTDSKYTVLKR